MGECQVLELIATGAGLHDVLDASSVFLLDRDGGRPSFGVGPHIHDAWRFLYVDDRFVRMFGYLLHPPFLHEARPLSALRWYAAGFAERSGLKVAFDLPATLERLPQERETALFRVVQEALINIHHHAESPTVLIRLRVDVHRLALDIEGHGHGVRPEVIAQFPAGGGALGVGIAGTRERLQQLGGTLDIKSSDRGTIVRARIPLLPDAP